MKEQKQKWLAGLLAGMLCLGNLVALPVSAETEEANRDNDTPSSTEFMTSNAVEEVASTSGIENWTLIESDRYTENLGDSFIDNIGTRNGNTTIDEVTYSSGLEMWIGRWNYKKEKSWAWATYALDSTASSFTGTLSVLKNSTNTTSYDTTVEILLDGEVVYSYRMTPGFTPQDISISLEGASQITISVYDNEAAEGGTSFCIGNDAISFGNVLYGDVNLDGRVDVTDAVLLNKAVTDAVKLDNQARRNADCNANGALGTDDAIVLLKFLVHLIDSLPNVN